MAIPLWTDLWRLFGYSSEKDPLSKKKDTKNLPNAGSIQPEAMPTDGAAGGPQGIGSGFRQTYDMIDTTTLNNRTMRYKEYDRLRNVPEIEMTMTVLADEACVSGDTKIATPFGFIPIETLAKQKDPEERFLVYSWDFEKDDYTLGWAFHPRKVKNAPTIEINLDDGHVLHVTPDHRILKKNNQWVEAQDLELKDELKPFYRFPASQEKKINQFPRVFSFHKGWIHEQQFLEEWKTGRADPKLETINRVIRMIGGGLNVRQIAERIGHDWNTVESRLHKAGFTHREIRSLYAEATQRRVVGIRTGPTIDVYDLSVEHHECFATDSVIMHNCQKDEDGNVFKINTANENVKKEVEFLLRHRQMLNLNRNSWSWFKNLCIFGDWFTEIVVNPDNPKEGIYKVIPLPPESMYRVETTKGKLIEFQQSAEGPDYNAIVRSPMITQATESELNQTKATRFTPFQIIHFRIGDDRKTFYPYRS